MLPPVRCFTCNKVLGHMYQRVAECASAEARKERCAELGVIRYCCRRMLLSSLDMSEHLNAFDTTDVNMDQSTALQVVHTGTTRLPTL
tara:strand:+ start:1575 stop:1838 length:264 start_codon:yes stop_codon:yes gene_type:complete